MKHIENDIKQWNIEVCELDLQESIRFACSKISGKHVFSTSFGIEDQILTDALSKLNFSGATFTLDTGRLFSQTYDVFEKTQHKYPNMPILTYFPNEADIKTYVLEDGINGFYNSIESRKRCCYIRKVAPLQNALEGASLWITGLRAEQSENRQQADFFQWDEKYQLVKFNPLINYTLEAVEAYVKTHKVPVNALYYKGFLSIGCAPCTRAIETGEDFRAGRWWWEASKKECGLHES